MREHSRPGKGLHGFRRPGRGARPCRSPVPYSPSVETIAADEDAVIRDPNALPLPARAGAAGPLPKRGDVRRRGHTGVLAAGGARTRVGRPHAGKRSSHGRAPTRHVGVARPTTTPTRGCARTAIGGGRFAVAGKSVLIAKPRSEIYAFWRDLSNQSRFMENVEAVRADGTRSTWTLRGLAGQRVEVEVDLTEEREGERLAWASVPGSQIETRGHVGFRDAPAGRGTYVRAGDGIRAARRSARPDGRQPGSPLAPAAGPPRAEAAQDAPGGGRGRHLPPATDRKKRRRPDARAHLPTASTTSASTPSPTRRS